MIQHDPYLEPLPLDRRRDHPDARPLDLDRSVVVIGFLWSRRRNRRAISFVALHPVRSYRSIRAIVAPAPWEVSS